MDGPAFLALLTAILVCAAVSVCSVAWGYRWRARPRRWLLALLIAVLAGAQARVFVGRLIRAPHYWDGIDLNPTFDRNDVVGQWEHGSSVLHLNDNGTFDRDMKPRGRWRVDAGKRALVLDDAFLRVITRDGWFELVPSRPDDWDADAWPVHSPFRRPGAPPDPWWED